eukprot:205779-Heterocapsa_arctica.AAC.1
MDTSCFLDRGENEGEDRVRGLFPGNRTERETDPRKVRGSHINEERSAEHRQDEEDAFQFLCGVG